MAQGSTSPAEHRAVRRTQLQLMRVARAGIGLGRAEEGKRRRALRQLQTRKNEFDTCEDPADDLGLHARFDDGAD